MAVITPPLYTTTDSVFTGASLGAPYRDWVREGVMGTADFKVTQRGAGANMSVDVAAGTVWVQGDDSVNQPTYRFYNDATVNLAISAAAAGSARIDVVIAEVRDSAYSGVNKDCQVRVITGTAAASPGTPAIPNNAVWLGQVLVGAGSTTIVDAQITDRRRLAGLKGDLDTTLGTFSTTVVISTTVSASAGTIVTAPTIVANGTDTYEVTFFCPGVSWSGGAPVCLLYDNGVSHSYVGPSTGLGNSLPLNYPMRMTPSAGTHQYMIRSYMNSTGTANWLAGAGTGGPNYPLGFLKVQRVA